MGHWSCTQIMTNCSDHRLDLQHAAFTTPRKASLSVSEPFSPESTYPTPPDSSPWQECDSPTVPKPAPLAFSRRTKESAQPRTPRNRRTKDTADPMTPKNRINPGRYSNFTPFHDIKQDIDDLIGELPGDHEDERQEVHDGSHLTLFLYSPSKKAAAQEYIDAQDDEDDQVLGGHELLILPYADLPAITQAEQHQPDAPSPSLLRRAGRMLKRTIMLFIPRGSTSHDVTIEQPGPGKKRNHTRPATGTQVSTRSRTTVSSLPSTKRLKLPISISRDFSLPIITAKTPVSKRRPEHITSTLRKPVPTPRLQHVKAAKSKTHFKARIQSQHASIHNLITGRHDIALAGASLLVKAAASLCVMALAAGADFLVEDWRMQRRVGRGRKRKVRRRCC